jgi:hypothetical protein
MMHYWQQEDKEDIFDGYERPSRLYLFRFL